MSKLIEKPHLIFLFSIPIIILSGLLSSNGTLDINIHDTYFVFSQNHLTILISIFFGIIGFGYWAMLKNNRTLSHWLNLIHIVLTFGGLILIIYFLNQIVETNAHSKSDDFARNIQMEMQIYFVALISLFGQIFYPINLIRGLTKKSNYNVQKKWEK